LTEAGEYRFFADWRSVPEVPNSALGLKKIGLWHRTLVPADGTVGRWVQAERGARPLQLFVVLCLSEEESTSYITGEPVDDAGFVAAFAHALEHTGGYAPEEAKSVAVTMLPDVLRYDPNVPPPFRTVAGHSPTTPLMSF
jgi:hypothetical protein